MGIRPMSQTIRDYFLQVDDFQQATERTWRLADTLLIGLCTFLRNGQDIYWLLKPIRSACSKKWNRLFESIGPAWPMRAGRIAVVGSRNADAGFCRRRLAWTIRLCGSGRACKAWSSLRPIALSQAVGKLRCAGISVTRARLIRCNTVNWLVGIGLLRIVFTGIWT